MNKSGAFLFSFQVAKQRSHHRTVVLMRSLGVLQFQEDRQEKSTKFNSWLLNSQKLSPDTEQQRLDHWVMTEKQEEKRWLTR